MKSRRVLCARISADASLPSRAKGRDVRSLAFCLVCCWVSLPAIFAVGYIATHIFLVIFLILFILIYLLIIFDKSRQFLPRPGLAGGYVDPHVFVHQSPY